MALRAPLAIAASGIVLQSPAAVASSRSCVQLRSSSIRCCEEPAAVEVEPEPESVAQKCSYPGCVDGRVMGGTTRTPARSSGMDHRQCGAHVAGLGAIEMFSWWPIKVSAIRLLRNQITAPEI